MLYLVLSNGYREVLSALVAMATAVAPSGRGGYLPEFGEELLERSGGWNGSSRVARLGIHQLTHQPAPWSSLSPYWWGVEITSGKFISLSLIILLPSQRTFTADRVRVLFTTSVWTSSGGRLFSWLNNLSVIFQIIEEFFIKGDLCLLKYEIQFTDVEERNQKTRPWISSSVIFSV